MGYEVTVDQLSKVKRKCIASKKKEWNKNSMANRHIQFADVPLSLSRI